MQHIMQFAFEFEDDKVRKCIEKNIEENITLQLKKDIEEKFFRKIYPYDDPIEGMVKEKVNEVVQENRDEIINLSAKMIADRLIRRKGVAEEIINNAKNKEE